MRLTFVVGSGRCGSTLLSRLLHQHPDVLSMSEFFSSVWMGPDDFPAGHPGGREFWDLLAAPQPYLDAMIREGYALPELCYPYGSGRFSPDTGVPRISHMTLPLLSSEPDALFDTLAAEVPRWRARPAADQFRALFGYLAQQLGRRVVVERSAGSAYLAHVLTAMFPDAKFVHLHRDGPDCALSLSRYRGVRLLGLAEQAGLLRGGSPEPGPLVPAGAELAALLTPPLDVRQIMTCPAPPLAVYGRLWSRMVTHGQAVLERLPQSSWTMLSYTDLLRDPDGELARLARFIGARPDPGWLAAARPLVDRGRGGQAAGLDPGDLATLRAACEPGRQAIERAAARIR